jgi:hypothetical protein
MAPLLRCGGKWTLFPFFNAFLRARPLVNITVETMPLSINFLPGNIQSLLVPAARNLPVLGLSMQY